MFELFMDYNDAIIDGEFTAFCKEDKANGRLSIKMSPKKGGNRLSALVYREFFIRLPKAARVYRAY